MSKVIKLLLIAILSTAAYTFNNMFPIPDWYQPLTQEVWTLTFQQVNVAEIVLFSLSGMAFWLLWKDRSLGEVAWPAWSYAGILILSSLWSLFFFGHEIPLLAFLDMVALTGMAVLATLQFYKYNKTAAYLLIPCILGAVFFAVNNFMLYTGYMEVTQA